MVIYNVKTSDGGRYSFVNDTWSNRTSWGHSTTLLFNDCLEVANNKVTYINRTWELYEYETCMQGCIENMYGQRLENYLNNYKTANKIDRFKKGQREEAINGFKNTDTYKTIVELREAVENRKWSK